MPDRAAKRRRTKVWKRVRRALRGPLVLAACWLGLVVVPRLSRRRVLALARVLGALTERCDRSGRRVAAANLQVFFGRRLTPRRARILVSGCYRRAALVGLDSLWFGRDTRARVARWSHMDAAGQKTVTATRPALVVAAHFGNWEMTLLQGGFMGVPLTAVVKHQWSPAVTARLNRLRTSLGARVVFAGGALRTLLRELRAGHVAGFLLDQYTAPADGGVWVDFGGLPAAVSGGVALLARRTGAAAILIFPYARRDGTHDFRVSAPLALLPGETDQDFTQRLVDGLVRTIRRHPSQWMLMYKRWTPVPPGADRAAYPFYARPLTPVGESGGGAGEGET